MGLTTDIYDDLDERNLRLAAVDRANAAKIEPAASLRQAAPPNPGERSFGFRSGAAPVGGVAATHFAEATEAGKELGAPTSFNAGAGAPAPIGVIRGMRQTFATEAGGPQLSEFATPLQARQASNRNQGVGEYEPAQGPALRLLAEKTPERIAQANLITEKGFRDVLTERLLKEYGVEDKEKGLILPPAIQRLALGHRPQSKEEVESILQQIAPEGGKIKTTNLWNDPKTGMAIRRQLLATTTDPAEQKRIKEEMVTPETLQWFEGRRTGGQPGASATGTMELPTANNLEQFTPEQGRQLRGLRQATESESRALQNMSVFSPFGPSSEELRSQMQEKAAERERQERKKDLQFLRLRNLGAR